MDTRYTPIFLSCSLLLASLPGWSQTYFAARSPEISAGQLDVLDLSTGISSQQIAVTISGQPIDGLTGMAHNYSTDLTYVLVKQDTSIRLAQIDLWTGVLSNAVTLPDKFASITFSTAGVLFGITGDGATVPESLYQIDPGTGNTTFVVSPGAGDDGEAIAFNTNEGLLYR
ncbi:MAG: hypothetical protein KDB88_02750, partial [Flavobacteriales bacterium]|nr:hypothetical protein [Flavobacteriales bacterium]